MADPQNHASRIKKAAAIISGWDCPLLTFIYPGFDRGSCEGLSKVGALVDFLFVQAAEIGDTRSQEKSIFLTTPHV